jgi:hypothetical protein
LAGRTYEGFAASWPDVPADPMARHMNELPNVVVSRTLTSVGWNATLVTEGMIDHVAHLKKRLALRSSPARYPWRRSLLQGLVDEYRLRITPAIVGTAGFDESDGPPRRALGTMVLSYSCDPSVGAD